MSPSLLARVLLLCCAGAAGGCSLLNAPNRDLLDGGASDAPDDAPDAPDAPPDGGVEICDPSNPGDEDGDGDADCADLDCTSAPACCGVGADTNSLVYEWDAEEDAAWMNWTETVPGLGDFPSVVDTDIEEYALEGFGSTSVADGIATAECLPLALGRTVEVAFTPLGGASQGDCNAGKAGVSIAFSAVTALSEGDPLPSEFSVEVTACGDVRARAGTTTVGTTASVATGKRFRMTITLTPGPIVAGETQLLATVRVPIGGKPTALVDGLPVVPAGNLVNDGACAETPGLYLALHGLGDGVRVGTLSSTGLECANPRQFRSVPGVLARSEAESLGAEEWAAGGAGAPAFFMESEEATLDASKMHLYFDGTNVPRGLDAEGITPLGFAIGHAVSVPGDPAAWSSRAGRPQYGTNPPACLPPTYLDCPGESEPALREPSVHYAQGETLFAYARENIVGGLAQRNRYGIDARRMPAATLRSITASDEPFEGPSLTPSDGGNCRSVRDPSLVPAPVDGENRYWLFFTCVPALGRPDIRAIRMVAADDEATVLTPDLDDGAHTVLSGAALGEYAEAGVFAPEVLLEADPEDPTRALYRLWFLARNRRRTETTVALAQWRPRAAKEAPAFEPFAGNPVLRDGDPSLSLCPGGARCSIGGWSVARADDTLLRFVLARTVNRAEGSSFHFETLEQTWSAPW